MLARVGIWLFVVIGVVLVQRAVELAISARNQAHIVARGGREYGARHFPWIAAMHALFPAALVVEAMHFGARPGRMWPLWLAAWLLAEWLRLAAMRALGPRWHVRVWVIPGAAPVTSGIYRRLRHPNYVGVALEFAAIPMLLGAWRTALVFSALNSVALFVRIRCENDALQRAAVDSLR
ncbi:MAG TPA: isoprenylcysteine carboxylmethyltransferase family protein [Candidatus Krumholzibacteria bacterium]|nr:isoprenylcysteine carboxylmethyltransferase family protein [Candidatus Krumholzibacteria bacterium]